MVMERFLLILHIIVLIVMYNEIMRTISEQAFIPEGAPEGYRIVFKGKGDQQPFSHPGNMIYTLHYALPTGYSIQKNDLIYEKRV